MISDIYILPMTVRGEIKSSSIPTLAEALEEIGDCIPILKELVMPNQVKYAVSLTGNAWVDLVGPLSTEAGIGPISINNRTGSSITFRIAISPNNAAVDNSHEIATDVSLAANVPVQFPGMLLPKGDVIRVRASVAGINFETLVSTPYA